jgi:hypothetical protein
MEKNRIRDKHPGSATLTTIQYTNNKNCAHNAATSVAQALTERVPVGKANIKINRTSHYTVQSAEIH